MMVLLANMIVIMVTMMVILANRIVRLVILVARKGEAHAAPILKTPIPKSTPRTPQRTQRR